MVGQELHQVVQIVNLVLEIKDKNGTNVPTEVKKAPRRRKVKEGGSTTTSGGGRWSKDEDEQLRKQLKRLVQKLETYLY